MEQENINPEQKNNMNLIITVIVIAVLILAGAWWWQKQKPETTSPQIGEQEPAGLGGQLYESVNNPIEGKVPETKPV